MDIIKNSFGYTISLGEGAFVKAGKTGYSSRCPVKIWKTRKGAEKYINNKLNNK